MLQNKRGGRWQGGCGAGEIKPVKQKRKVREKEEKKRTFIINSLNRQAVRLRCRPCSAWASAALLNTSHSKPLSPPLTSGCLHITCFCSKRSALSIDPREPCKAVSSSNLPLSLTPPLPFYPCRVSSEIWASWSTLILCVKIDRSQTGRKRSWCLLLCSCIVTNGFVSCHRLSSSISPQCTRDGFCAPVGASELCCNTVRASDWSARRPATTAEASLVTSFTLWRKV